MTFPTLQDYDYISTSNIMRAMTAGQLDEEFTRLVKCRNESDGNDYDLPIYVAQAIAKDRGITLPPEVTEEEIIKPKSRGISWVKYFFVGKCMQVRYTSSDRVYTYYDVPRSKFAGLKRVIEKGESLGHYVASIKKEYGIKK